MHLIYEALKKTGGNTDGDSIIAAMKGMAWESARGPIAIDPETRDIVQDIYVRRLERVRGELQNIEFDKFDAVKDPIKRRRGSLHDRRNRSNSGVAMGRSETALHRIVPISSPGAINHGQYIFDNAAAETATRFSALATIFDPGTIRHLTEIGVTKGWTCLEIGAGGGTIADWLCDRVGPEGRVMATDIDTQYLNSLNKPNLDVRRHDIARDVPPEETFDLVHVRLVLAICRHGTKFSRALSRH